MAAETAAEALWWEGLRFQVPKPRCGIERSEAERLRGNCRFCCRNAAQVEIRVTMVVA